MTFVGVLIVTFHLFEPASTAPCPVVHTCGDDSVNVAVYRPPPDSEPVPIYVGEFDSLDACDKAIENAFAKAPKDVNGLHTSLCIPKTSVDWKTAEQRSSPWAHP